MEPTLIEEKRDTICAISTPPGTGGVAMIRISGPEALAITSEIWKGADLLSVPSHTLHLGKIIDTTDSSLLDQAVAAIYHAPNSFTGDDVVELNVHGSPYIQKRLIRLLIEHGARLALPGEFTRRAFASGKLNLTQAEAVADVIAAQSRAAHRIAASQFTGSIHRRLNCLREQLTELAALLELELDFSEEDVEFADRSRLKHTVTEIEKEIRHLYKTFDSGNAIKNGISVAIAGATNAGKSSLLNCILDDDRAIVSNIHGTTRDTIEETIELGDYTFRFIDTAGLRNTDDSIEQLGIERSLKAITAARIILYVVDSTTYQKDYIKQHLDEILHVSTSDSHIILVYNKTDLLEGNNSIAVESNISSICISAATGFGIDALKQQLILIARQDDSPEDIMITNERHRRELQSALESIAAVNNGLESGLSTDLIAIDLRDTLRHLSQLTGAVTTPDILTHIFSHFCVGK